jgi:hypothetical protein
MRKFYILLLVIILLVASTTPAFASKPDGAGGGNANGHAQEANGKAVGHTREQGTGDKLNAPGQAATKGFDEFGYNDRARIFNGTALTWCMAKPGATESQCLVDMGAWANDKLIMKWNAEWDRGNAEDWLNPPYNAWLSNHWNGKIEDGSGEVWHYKFVWVGDCVADPGLVPDGGYCIWGQFATLSDHGTGADGHVWLAHANPTGYGTYP